ncbi:MAG: VOC family protein [Verrucomicrobiota bacterium]
MNRHEKINYVEFPASDMKLTKHFFGNVFGWDFQDYGPEYIAFSDQGLDGGFYLSDKFSSTEKGAALVIFYSERLEETLGKVEAAGGKIIKPVFAFPGGRRFHFSDPNGNEFAVWSDKAEDVLITGNPEK